MSKQGMKYDYKKAYDKNLKPGERLHYLENARHDKDTMAKMHGHGSMAKQYGSMAKNYMNPQEYKVFNMGNKPIPLKQDISPIMSHCGMARFEGQAKRDLKDMPITKDASGGRKSSVAKMDHK
ncbi:MAG: hypothetical protein GY928_38635 [Colwellia sp.]|nr:hypothetical protein [Colwellia sp.]